MKELLTELKRRSVFRVAAAYAVVAWILIEVSDTIFPRIGLPDWSVTLVIALVALGFPLALFLAWAYELTPEGLKRDAEARAEPSAPRTSNRTVSAVVVMGLVLVIGWLAADRFWPRDGSASGGLIAVLPFRNRSVREEDAFFAEGIHDDLLTQLSKIAAFKVISRTSMMRYADSTLSVPQIAGSWVRRSSWRARCSAPGTRCGSPCS
jgi:hypothetical protein